MMLLYPMIHDAQAQLQLIAELWIYSWTIGHELLENYLIWSLSSCQVDLLIHAKHCLGECQLLFS